MAPHRQPSVEDEVTPPAPPTPADTKIEGKPTPSVPSTTASFKLEDLKVTPAFLIAFVQSHQTLGREQLCNLLFWRARSHSTLADAVRNRYNEIVATGDGFRFRPFNESLEKWTWWLMVAVYYAEEEYSFDNWIKACEAFGAFMREACLLGVEE